MTVYYFIATMGLLLLARMIVCLWLGSKDEALEDELIVVIDLLSNR